jgi:8-oxo-dGTP pyrophosphatase MutT (NUDIX family)
VSAPLPRVAGRVMVIDPAGRMLLIHERIWDGSTHWVAPGGGVEPGETPQQAAVRELAEETGIVATVAPDAESVLVTRGLWSWADATYDQVDHFFVARVAAGLGVSPGRLTDIETQTLLGYRWWSVAGLRATDDVVEPPQLVDALGRLSGASTADVPAAGG